MNRHYKKRAVKILKPVYVAYRDYTEYTNCTRMYGVFDSIEKAKKWIEWDAEFNQRRYKVSWVIDYNDPSEIVLLGNRIGDVFEIRMNKSGRKAESNCIRYVIFQTYVNRSAV